MIFVKGKMSIVRLHVGYMRIIVTTRQSVMDECITNKNQNNYNVMTIFHHTCVFFEAIINMNCVDTMVASV